MGRIAGSLGMTANTAFAAFARQFVAHRAPGVCSVRIDQADRLVYRVEGA